MIEREDMGELELHTCEPNLEGKGDSALGNTV